MKKALAQVTRRYDVVVIDCPPGLSVLTVNALAAADAYIVPVAPHRLDLEALNGFLGWSTELRSPARQKPPELLGILLTLVDHRTR